jgi:TonB family protein
VLQTIADPSPGYPGDALERYDVGAVVLYMRLDARGRVVDRAVIASVPSASLEPAVTAVAERWRVEREPGTPRDCRMPSSHFVPNRFFLQ